MLDAEGVGVEMYHGRLGAAARHQTQDKFMRGDLKAVVATNAFGMGIDKPDIRFVVHAQSALCRWKLLLEYFGEADGFDRCGTCDNCVTPMEDRLTPPGDRDRPSFLPR